MSGAIIGGRSGTGVFAWCLSEDSEKDSDQWPGGPAAAAARPGPRPRAGHWQAPGRMARARAPHRGPASASHRDGDSGSQPGLFWSLEGVLSPLSR